MQDRRNPLAKHYRLELSARGGQPAAPAIEFAAEGPETALHVAERDAAGRSVTIFEDGRPLARLRHAAEHGFWTIAPGPPPAR